MTFFSESASNPSYNYTSFSVFYRSPCVIGKLSFELVPTSVPPYLFKTDLDSFSKHTTSLKC